MQDTNTDIMPIDHLAMDERSFVFVWVYMRAQTVQDNYEPRQAMNQGRMLWHLLQEYRSREGAYAFIMTYILARAGAIDGPDLDCRGIVATGESIWEKLRSATPPPNTESEHIDRYLAMRMSTNPHAKRPVVLDSAYDLWRETLEDSGGHVPPFLSILFPS